MPFTAEQEKAIAVAPESAIGYKQVVQLLKGELEREAAISAIEQAHRNYAKRQMTWFGRDKSIQWIDSGDWEQLKNITQS